MEFFEHIQAALVRHGDIEQHDITWVILDHTHRFLTIGSFATNGHSSAFRDNAFQPFTNDGMVINYNNINHLTGVKISIRVPRPGEK